MDKERELDNLNIMLKNGLINEQTYQAQRRALLGVSAASFQPVVQNKLKPLSLLEAYKFSFQPTTFGANLVFLFITLMVILAFVGTFKNIAMSLKVGSLSVAQSIIIETSVLTFIFLWLSSFITFFSRLSLEQLNRESSPFQLKNFVLKSLSFLGIFSVGFILYIGLDFGLVFVARWLKTHAYELWPQYIPTFFVILLACIKLGFFYLLIASSTACIGSAKNWGKTVIKAFKRPLLIVFGGACLLFNGVILFILSKIFKYYTEKSFDKMAETVMETIISISGWSLFGIYVLLGIILFFVYSFASKYVRLLIKISFLFIIPSAIMLWIIFAGRSVIPSLPASFYFAYFLIMHFIWVIWYCSFFFATQGIAFFAHILTQIWCHLTYDKKEPPLFPISDKQAQPQMPRTEPEQEYVPPEVFR